MYSWEIHAVLEKYNYVIPLDVYDNICNSQQVQRIKYEPFNDNYELYTTDGYYWKFKVERKELLL